MSYDIETARDILLVANNPDVLRERALEMLQELGHLVGSSTEKWELSADPSDTSILYKVDRDGWVVQRIGVQGTFVGFEWSREKRDIVCTIHRPDREEQVEAMGMVWVPQVGRFIAVDTEADTEQDGLVALVRVIAVVFGR